MSSQCPKCGGKLKATYFKQTCPHCGVNLMYYKLDERLEEDARQAAAEVAKVEHFKETVKNSTVKTPWHIARLVLFFTPLASMCLPMYYAGGKTVTLPGVIMGIINHGFAPAVWDKGHLFGALAIVSVILLSLAVIIASLFSAGKKGFRRNFLFSAVNTAVFGALSVLVCTDGGRVGVGFYITLLIYLAELWLHEKTADVKTPKRTVLTVAAVVLCGVIAAVCALIPKAPQQEYTSAPKAGDLRVISFNTAAPWGTPFDGTASKDRAVRFDNYMAQTQPDLIGTQELNSAWLEYLKTADGLSGYESYAVKRGGDDNERCSEMNGIFWKKDRFTAAETNTFWLSNTPETESRFTYTDENGEEQSAACNRICSYAVLKEVSTGAYYAFMNTHLDHVCEAARDMGAALILQRIVVLKTAYPGIHIVLTGDFNGTADSNACQIIAVALHDTTDSAKQQATWQDWGYTDTGNEPIDFIYTDGTAAAYAVLSDIPDGYVSDHYGVMADIDF